MVENGMSVVLILAVIAPSLLLIGLGLYAKRSIQREKAQLLDTLRDFVTAPAEGKLSPLAELVELCSARLAAHIISNINETMRTTTSQVKRQENALQGELFVGALSEKSPIMGLVAGAFPDLTKRLLKNPTAMIALQNLLMRQGNGGAQPSEASQGGSPRKHTGG
jgi:hypothetical protein